ncbi:SDR family NAD(P)-dependent oxidoreductase [Actinokineospora enzanensis]|uniref:SDR family NAD(P)-dependent oxidoreductase n=1 Tax=Actinokineospora enzanensis TaxID=155975 RepID=UPI00035E9E76|nr:SDR family oxidoreductase [Actinokineospora enzanensis]
MTRTVLVTGANRGLGRAVAARLRADGLRVVVTARDGDRARAVAAELGPDAVGLPLDVTDPDGVLRVKDAIGHVDALVNNAGVLLDAGGDPLAVPLDSVRATLAVNLLGAWQVTQAFVPGMVAAGWGRVVMVSSGTGTFANGLFPRTPGYSVSKAALNGLTAMLAARLAGTGVLVNAVNPGRVRTRMMPDAPRSAADAAGDVAAAVLLPDDGPNGVLLREREPSAW